MEKEGRNEVGRDGSDGNRVRGKKLTVTFCFIASYISMEREWRRGTEEEDEDGRVRKRRRKTDRRAGADTDGSGRDGWGKQKKQRSCVALRKCVWVCSAEYNRPCILTQKQCVWCLLEGHRMSVYSLQCTQRHKNLWGADTWKWKWFFWRMKGARAGGRGGPWERRRRHHPLTVQNFVS